MAENRTTTGRTNRGPSKTSPVAIKRRDRDLKVVELRAAGHTWSALANQLGLTGASHAYRRFIHVMRAYPPDHALEGVLTPLGE